MIIQVVVFNKKTLNEDIETFKEDESSLASLCFFNKCKNIDPFFKAEDLIDTPEIFETDNFIVNIVSIF